jgi:hypothetical protein
MKVINLVTKKVAEKIFTREDYSLNRCSHHDYYSQFVNVGTIERLLKNISRSRIELSDDDCFNDIPNHTWDSIVLHPFELNSKAFEKSGEVRCPAVRTCLLKAAARQLKEQKGDAFVKWAVQQLK